MKLAAVTALAKLAREPQLNDFDSGSAPTPFGPGYLIPTPLDPRVVPTVAPAVAAAAIESGAASVPSFPLRSYADALRQRLTQRYSPVAVAAGG